MAQQQQLAEGHGIAKPAGSRVEEQRAVLKEPCGYSHEYPQYGRTDHPFTLLLEQRPIGQLLDTCMVRVRRYERAGVRGP